MQLTLHTDYGLRLMLYLAAAATDDWIPVKHVAESYAISTTHLIKVAQHLTGLGYLESKQGRGGGVRLGVAPREINVGEVVRQLEPSLAPVVCLDPETPEERDCRLSPSCGLKRPLAAARDAFLSTLDGYTLDRCIRRKGPMRELLQITTHRK
ncbi:MAG: Rrf2 family transcriptional regulator [Myxococcota bacterium]